MKPLVLLDAAPFCYGPVSTLMAIVNALSEMAADTLDLVLLASGTSREFAAVEDRVRIEPCDTESRAALERAAPWFDACRLFVCNTNPPSARFALQRGCPVMYIDTLFWMWDALDPVVARAPWYVVQDFAGTEANRARLGKLGTQVPGFHLTGPLITTARAVEREPRCLVSYGGMESSLGDPDQARVYGRLMTRLILKALSDRPEIEEIRFCGRGPVMADLAERFTATDPRARFGFLPHRQYLDALARCRLHLLSPGLTGAFEAQASGAPTCLLLPQNYSQQLQAAHFLAAAEPDGARAFAGTEWGEIYPDGRLPSHLPEPEAVARVSALIRRFDEDAAAQARYLTALRRALGDTTPSEIAGSARPSGTQEVADLICAHALGLSM